MKLVEKDALVAEIERRLNFHHKRGNQHDSCVEDVLYGILSYIDTLKVKEVDFNKELSNYMDKFIKKDAKIGNKLSIRRTAKHFFELGLKTQKGE